MTPAAGRRPRLLLLPVALFAVLLEATLWRWLAAIGAQLARLPLFAAIERLIDRLSPPAVILVFVLPFVPIIPALKVGEVWLLTHGHYLWAGAVILGTKVFGAAFSTRVFAIARPKMRQVRWFAWVDGRVGDLLARGHAFLDGLPAWVAARAALARLRRRLRAGRAFRAALRWGRRRGNG